MSDKLQLPVYWGLIDYLASIVSPEQVLAFRTSPDIQERLGVLIEKNNEGDISPEERRELDAFIKYDQCVMLVKARAAAALKNI